MKMKKVMVTMFVMLMCAFVVKPTEVQAATTFEEMKVTVVDDMRDYNQVVGLSWKVDWNLNKATGVTSQTRYGKFTIPTDSYVRIQLAVENENTLAAKETFKVYGNASMAAPIVTNDIGYGSGDDYLLLKAGTYYVECGTELYNKSESNHTVKVMIGAIPVEKAYKITKTVSKDGKSVTISVEQKFAENLRYLKWYDGVKSNGYVVSVVGEAMDPSTQSFTVKKNGTYTVLIQPESTVAWNQEVEILEYVTVNEVGANLSKNTTYKSGNLKYKLVKAGLNGTGTVMVTGVVKQKSSITIPKTVKLKGHSYKVVKINKNAFKGKSKIKKITIKSTYITSVGKNAIKGINKKATIKVPKSKLKTYKKLFKKSTGYLKTMKIKK